MDKPPKDDLSGHEATIVRLMCDIYKTTQDAQIDGFFIVVVGRNLNCPDGLKNVTWERIEGAETALPELLKYVKKCYQNVEADLERISGTVSLLEKPRLNS